MRYVKDFLVRILTKLTGTWIGSVSGNDQR